MKNLSTLLVVLSLMYGINTKAQDASPTGPSDGAAHKTIWSIGISGVVIDDDGNPFTDLFNVSDSWHFVPYPSRLHVDAACNNNWSIEAAVSLTRYQSGKMVNDVVMNEDNQFLAFDMNARYHFITSAGLFDPYGVAGLGFTYRSALQEQTPTFNIGLGTNIWFVRSFGLNLQTTAKLKLNAKSSNYMMHSVGVVYRFGK